MTAAEQSEIEALFKAAFDAHEKVERNILAAHERLDDARFAILDERLGARMKWLKWLTLTNALAVLAALASLAVFFLAEHDVGVANRESIVSVRLAIERLHNTQIADRELDRKEAAEDRALASSNAQADRNQASANRQSDRMKSLQNNAADRAKARAEREADRAKAKPESKPAQKAPAHRPFPTQGPGPWPSEAR